MAIFERIGDLIKSNVNDLIDRAEDPEKMIKQVIIDMEEELRKTTSALGQAMGSKTGMQKQLDDSIEETKKWEARAKSALEAGNEELAKQALNNKVTVEKNINQYREMVQKMDEQINKIKTQVEEIKVKLEEARAKQSMLIARDTMAETNLKMAETMGNFDSKSANAKMEKILNGKETAKVRVTLSDIIMSWAYENGSGYSPYIAGKPIPLHQRFR